MWKLPSLRSTRRRPSVPEGVRIYAVGDVHGRADLLALLLTQIDVDSILHPVARPITVFLGDYIDRGPASKCVLDLLLTQAPPEAVFLKGNHEDLLLKFLQDATVLDTWRYCGGLETLVTYGLKPPINPSPSDQIDLARDLARALPDNHRTFLQSLALSFVCGDFLFVHAGVRPLVPLRDQTENDLLWIRNEFLLWEKDFEKIVVHGHTPVREPDIRANRINIDTGAFATGRLTCMTIEGAEIMPLLDVRDWVDRLSGSDAGLWRGAQPRRRNAAAEHSACDPAAAAVVQARTLVDSAADDPALRARLDPRR